MILKPTVMHGQLFIYPRKRGSDPSIGVELCTHKILSRMFGGDRERHGDADLSPQARG